MKQKRVERGFTLIELMIVVAVIAILASIAYPAYQEQIRKSRRTQAKGDIAQITQLLERYRTANNTYVGYELKDEQKRSPLGTSGTKYYDIGLADVAVSAYTVTATPVAGGSQAKDRCGNLSINQAGKKANSKGTSAECW